MAAAKTKTCNAFIPDLIFFLLVSVKRHTRGLANREYLDHVPASGKRQFVDLIQLLIFRITLLVFIFRRGRTSTV